MQMHTQFFSVLYIVLRNYLTINNREKVKHNTYKLYENAFSHLSLVASLLMLELGF